MARDVRKAVAAREAASARVRRVSVGLVAVGAALTAAFSSLAASSTHFAKAKHVVSHRTTRRARVHTSTSKPKPVVAPAPPLVGDGGSAPTPPPSSSSPAPAPAPAPSTPVVVSGGS